MCLSVCIICIFVCMFVKDKGSIVSQLPYFLIKFLAFYIRRYVACIDVCVSHVSIYIQRKYEQNTYR